MDKNGDVRYGVKERTYWKEDEKQHQRDGPTIGHIESGIFVPIPEDPIPPISYAESDMLSWGPYQLIVNRTQDLMEDLPQVYNPSDAEKIYTLAILRTAEGGLKDYEAKDAMRTATSGYSILEWPWVRIPRGTAAQSRSHVHTDNEVHAGSRGEDTLEPSCRHRWDVEIV